MLKKITIEEETKIEKLIRHLKLDLKIKKMIKQLLCPPTVTTIFVLWNKEFNYYKK